MNELRYKIVVDSKLVAAARSAELSAHLVDLFYKRDEKGRYPEVELLKGTVSLQKYSAMEPK